MFLCLRPGGRNNRALELDKTSPGCFHGVVSAQGKWAHHLTWSSPHRTPTHYLTVDVLETSRTHTTTKTNNNSIDRPCAYENHIYVTRHVDPRLIQRDLHHSGEIQQNLCSKYAR
jgi:hypothetical protein